MAKKKKKQKAGSIAIPFLITFLIALLVLGLPTIYFYNKLINNSLSSDTSKDDGTYQATQEDSTTILFALDPEDDMYLNSFVLLRTIPYTRTFVVLPIANSMNVNGGATTVDAVYTNNGITELRKTLESELDMKIDYYMLFRDEGFEKLCDIIGCTHYTVPSGLKGFNPEPQFLSSDGMNRLITHYAFSSEEQRMAITGGVISQMLNEAMGDRVAGNIDSSFNSVSELAETDVTSLAYTKGRAAIIYMFSEDKYTAQFRNIEGEWAENGLFNISSGDIQDVHDWFGLSESDSE